MKKDAEDTSLSELAKEQNATFRAQSLSAVPNDLLTMHNLLSLDLSQNRITRFPGDLVVRDFPQLEVLRLQHNLLYVLEDILALSVAPRLRELNVSANPLRLLENRIYFLEALFNAAACGTKALRTVHNDPTLTALALSLPVAALGGATPIHAPKRKMSNAKTNSTKTMTLVHRLPRLTGFPMVQKVNGLWIMDDEIQAVERERGRAIEYFNPQGHGHAALVHDIRSDRSMVASNSALGRRADGSRMTANELIKQSKQPAAIPAATVIQRYQIDVDSSGFVEDDDERDDMSEQGGDDETEASGVDTEEMIHQLFASEQRKKQSVKIRESPTPSFHEDGVPLIDEWNYPIRSFDTLTGDDRQYIRHRSRQSVESNLQRDDHFFDSSVYLDSIAQAERSRRLTIRAVDTLCPPTCSPGDSLSSCMSAPSLHEHTALAVAPISTAALELRTSLASKFNKNLDDKKYEKLEKFLRQSPPQVAGSVDNRDMQAALGELFLNEHMEQRQYTRKLLETYVNDGATCGDPLDVVATQLDDSLSKTKLRNAVDLANALLLNKKQEKRMMQMLIDTDAKAIEHERASLEQALHRHRLDLIASNIFYSNEQAARKADREWMAEAAKHATPSPWQARNWRAKEAQRRGATQHAQNKYVHESGIIDVGVDAGWDTTGGYQTKSHLEAQPTSRSRGATHSKATRRGNPAKKTRTPSSPPVAATTDKRPASAAPTTRASAPSTKETLRKQHSGSVNAKFRTIETVEQAARDPLNHVDSHDLLVRCAAIRQRAESHTQGLAHYRDQFLEDEAAWEAMRQDPINIVRRHLRRNLYQDAQEIQIAGTQLFYSSLFQ